MLIRSSREEVVVSNWATGNQKGRKKILKKKRIENSVASRLDWVTKQTIDGASREGAINSRHFTLERSGGKKK